MRRCLTHPLIFAFVLFAGFQATSQELAGQDQSISEMAKSLPGNINAVMSVDVKAIKESDLGKKEGWGTSYAGKVASGLIFIPDGANVVLLGAAMDYDTFHPRETALLVSMDHVPDVSIIREITGGSMDEILDTPVIETQDDRYIVRLNDHMALGLRPAMRPYLTNWLKDLKQDKKARVKDYLEEGLAYSDLGTEIIAAFNLEHAISRNRIYDRIKDNELLKEQAKDPREVARLFTSARGFTLGVTVTDKVFGAVVIDFAEDISSLHDITRPLALGVLARAGIELPEFEGWELEATANRIRIFGDMSTASMRKVLSVVDAPQHTTTAFASSESVRDSEYHTPATVNKNYFDAIDSFLADLEPKTGTQFSYTTNANWMKTYAEKIDSLPLLNIDPELLNYGNEVSQTLRDASLLLIQTREDSKTRYKQLIASGSRRGGDFGYAVTRHGRYGYGKAYGYRRWGNGGDGSRMRRYAMQQEQSDVVKEIAAMFEKMATSRREVRQSMAQKYQIEF